MSRYRLVLRVVLEARSPLSIASGETDPRFDVLLARDANGLPMLPGTSVAGLLRHVVTLMSSPDEADKVFGCARSGADGRSTEASPLTVTNGVVHDGHDRPVDGLLLSAGAARLADDRLLRRFLDLQPIKRDHVRLSVHGVAEDTGKFDRAGVPCGARFTLQFELPTDDPDDPRWARTRAALVHPLFRLGGGSRNGYGELAIVRATERCFDLKRRSDVEDLPRSSRLDEPFGGRDIRRPALAASLGVTVLCTELIPRDAWRYGADGTPRETASGQEVPHLVAVREAAVVWRRSGQGETGTLIDGERYILPGSSIKGALRHRTLFHLHRLRRVFVNADGKEVSKVEAAVAELFGRVDGEAVAGCVAVSDAVAGGDFAVGTLWHNGIDRFAGGVRAGVLYGEELVFAGSLSLTVVLTERGSLAPDVRLALRHALEDLAAGRLALGAGTAKGHGVMTAPGMTAALAAADTWFGKAVS